MSFARMGARRGADLSTAPNHDGDTSAHPSARSAFRGADYVSLARMRTITLSVIDTLCWLVAGFTVFHLAEGRPLSSPATPQLAACMAAAVVTNIVVGALALKTYRRRYRTGSFDEAFMVAIQFVLAGVAMAAVAVLWPLLATAKPVSPVSVALIPGLALVAALTVRFSRRLSRTYQRSQYYRRLAHDQERVVVVGAGAVGEQIIQLTKFDPASPFVPVGLVDDDPTKANLRLMGVPVVGRVDSVIEACAAASAGTVIIAVADFPTEALRRVTAECSRHGIRVMTMVPVRQLARRRLHISDIKEIDLAEVLGRREVHTAVSQIAGYVNGRRVLVSGAGGSIGSELARQLHRLGPRELVLLDRDESALHAIQLDIYNKGLLDTRDMVLCDIRDRDALEQVFAEHRPEVVFHAAALKHLPMLEQYPEEGWKTNVLGSKNVLELALKYRAGILVNISTDKAADPTSVLGRTKRLAEQMTTCLARTSGMRFVSVRFGNVLGSRGSVLWTFKHQIDSGGPVTITHPDVERFFMTIPEACELVLQAGALKCPGDTMVLDMGEPVKILDVARRLIAQSGQDIDVEFTGLRPGEKLSEDLIAQGEHDERPFHPLISHVHVQAVDPRQIEAYHAWAVGDSPVEFEEIPRTHAPDLPLVASKEVLR